MIIQIFIAQGQPIYALSKHLFQTVITTTLNPGIVQITGQGPGQPKATIGLAQQQAPTFTGYVAAPKIGLDFT